MSLVQVALGTANTTSAPGGNETDLPAGGSVTTDGGWLSDVLMVTSSVGMVNGLSRRGEEKKLFRHFFTQNKRPSRNSNGMDGMGWMMGDDGQW